MSLNSSGPTTAATVDEARKSDQLGSKIGFENNAPADTNQYLKFHPLADIFPLMEGAEFDALVADIKAKGQRDPIVLFDGRILDGRNRYRACLAAGITPDVIKGDIWVGDPAAYVISANIQRRHLKPKDRIKILAQLVAAQPEKSDRHLAKQAGVSHPTIAKARKRAEATGKALPVAKRVGADGKARKQPATKAERNRKARAYRARQRQQMLAENRKIDQAGKAAAKAEAEQLAADLITAGLARRLYDHLSEYGAYELIDALMPDAETKRSRKRQMDQAVREVDRAMQGRPYDERSAARAAERERLRKQWALEDDGTKSLDGIVSYPPHIARVTP